MSLSESPTPATRSWKRWAIPATAVLGGVVYFAAGWLGGDRAFAFGGLAVMLVFVAAFLVLGRLSETVAGLINRNDERINRIDSDASLFAGMTLVCAVLIGFVVEIARGQDGQPYAALGAIAGIGYVVALIVLRIRR